MVVYLLVRGADVNRKNGAGLSAMYSTVARAVLGANSAYMRIFEALLSASGVQIADNVSKKLLEGKSPQCIYSLIAAPTVPLSTKLQFEVIVQNNLRCPDVDATRTRELLEVAKKHDSFRCTLAKELGVPGGVKMEELAASVAKQMKATLSSRTPGSGVFVPPKQQEASAAARLVLSEYDFIVRSRGQWTAVQKVGMHELLDACSTFFEDEVARAAKQLPLLQSTYRELHATHQRPYLSALECISSEPGWKRAMCTLGKWTTKLGEAVVKQPSNDVVELYEQAAVVRKRYENFMRTIAKKSGARYVEAKPKGLWRVAEKVGLRPKGMSEAEAKPRVCDITRGLLEFDTCGKLNLALMILEGCDINMGDMQDVSGTNERIQIMRCKNRFDEPTSGGWADAMINFVFDGSNGHVCEIQLGHQQLLFVRQEWGAHASYDRFRSALELIEANGEKAIEIEEKRASLAGSGAKAAAALSN